jgi:hypothetical protein
MYTGIIVILYLHFYIYIPVLHLYHAIKIYLFGMLGVGGLGKYIQSVHF